LIQGRTTMPRADRAGGKNRGVARDEATEAQTAASPHGSAKARFALSLSKGGTAPASPPVLPTSLDRRGTKRRKRKRPRRPDGRAKARFALVTWSPPDRIGCPVRWRMGHRLALGLISPWLSEVAHPPFVPRTRT